MHVRGVECDRHPLLSLHAQDVHRTISPGEIRPGSSGWQAAGQAGPFSRSEWFVPNFDSGAVSVERTASIWCPTRNFQLSNFADRLILVNCCKICALNFCLKSNTFFKLKFLLNRTKFRYKVPTFCGLGEKCRFLNGQFLMVNVSEFFRRFSTFKMVENKLPIF